MEYKEFLESKKKTFIPSGFECSEFSPLLKDFQKYSVEIAIKKGRFALFFDCGLGKTFCQLEWAKKVVEYTKKPVLVLCPLAIVEQTINEGVKFGINVEKLGESIENSIYITNYDKLKNIDTSIFSGIVLDESSILKGKDGKTSKLILESFKKTPYKLACTATPSPNDHMELGMHSEFLGGMSYLEMLSMFFVHDGGETSKWRLRKHAADNFWKYIATWSIAIDNPSTLGFDSEGYFLPEVEYIEHLIPVINNTSTLFADVAVSATELHKDLKLTFDYRIQKTIELVNSNNDQWIVWSLSNKETDNICKKIDGINVQGSDSPEYKAKFLNGFANNEFRVLITKTSIASFGMNYQNCCNMIFMSYDFKFEQFYQAVRRCYRFGQKEKVKVHILIPESQTNVRQSILDKQLKHKQRIHEMSKFSADTDYSTLTPKVELKQKEYKTDNYWLLNGDCVIESKKIPDNSADISIFSPPFPELYVYSDKHEDMNNVTDFKQFESHFKFLIPELKRIVKQGRIIAIHCMDSPIQKGKEGFIGLRDFSGDLIKWFSEFGFIYHSRVTIWKDPVVEMQRTKALGLLHKTIKKDSVMSRVGIPDYVLIFRNGDGNETPITHQDKDVSLPDYLPVELWQKYASPIWYDINYQNTLQYRSARDGNDEKHITPLQLETIERLLHLYSNEGEVCFSPFGGIGSEGFQAIKMNRKSISIELKDSYFKINEKNHRDITNEKNTVLTLF